MEPTYKLAGGRGRLYAADCIEVMGSLPESRVSVIVTDPPYGLSFMGREWDDLGRSAMQQVEWHRRWAEQAYRVLKPGGHLLAFGGTRTAQYLALGLEFAGFEIRDTLCWLYGSGFPKSLDVSKAIDRAAGAEREVTGRALGHVPTEGGTFDDDRYEWQPEYNRTDHPATDAAREWEGWGTALKPAWEPIVLARKPLSGTVAQNVLAHGTGGLNIDGTRIAGPPAPSAPARANSIYGSAIAPDAAEDRDRWEMGAAGRWPANVVLDEEAAALLDEQAGERPASGAAFTGRPAVATNHGMFALRSGNGALHADSGGPSRFFYTAKASRSERERGLRGHLPCTTCDEVDSETHLNAKGETVKCRRNAHPTVKPLKLMQWLVALATPPGGIVLDPFVGSGTTGVAVLPTDALFIGVDADPQSIEVANLRMLDALA